MTLKLTKELDNALHANGPDGLEVIDPATIRIYMIVDGEQTGATQYPIISSFRYGSFLL